MKIKRLSALFLAALLICSLTGCGRISGNLVRNDSEESTLYTEAEITDAVKAAEQYFRWHFSGCTLTAIGYAGDDVSLAHAEWAERTGGNETLVLTSEFTVDGSGGDGSLNPNSTCRNWKWIMVRKNGGSWEHADHGY